MEDFMTAPTNRMIIRDGNHTREVLAVLGKEITPAASLHVIAEKAAQIIERAVDPIAGEPEFDSDGLLYGLIQSGKTSIITVASAMAADNGFDCLVILTSDIDLLYEQTLERITKALRGLRVLGKNDWKDTDRFQRQLRNTPFVVVCSKNSRKLNSLLEAFKSARAKGLSVMIVDDEADQASLNTKTSKGSGEISPINEAITAFRDYFPVNTYLQVTATPQALFLQRPDHRYHPSFTVLSEPGPGYVGGEVFFGPESHRIIRSVDLHEIDQLRSTHQPAPSATLPSGLRKALLTFLVAATARAIETSENYAFLCHVSVNKRDHEHIVKLIDRFKTDSINTLHNPTTQSYARLKKEMQAVYQDLENTQPGLPDFNTLEEKIKFYLNGTNIKLINASSSEEIKLDSAYNVFVGGNKLGRGVTIKNLLTSYYGRNPKRPNADTVLQHARMYGYRSNDIGVTRLFLPDTLADHFRLIHQMERSLRNLLTKYPDGKFEGIFVTSPLRATRTNVLDPNSLGFYVAGQSVNPTYPLRTPEARADTEFINSKAERYKDNASHEVTIDFICQLLARCKADPKFEIKLWDINTLRASLETVKELFGDKAYLVIKRDLTATKERRESQGIVSGKGEEDLAPRDAPTLFLHREKAHGGEAEAWWPQLRFPEGNYMLAFSFDW
jgi:hypothetical protein